MRCVWVEAYRGSERIPGGVESMSKVQFAVDQRSQGHSSWLRVVREKTDAKSVSPKGAAPGSATATPAATPVGTPKGVP
jgi:hypothetical protein